MITVKNVRKQFPGGVQAVKDISFQIKKGEVLVLVGLSGSGKTTALKMINRLITPDAFRYRLPEPWGHGRNGSAEYTGAQKVIIPHSPLSGLL